MLQVCERECKAHGTWLGVTKARFPGSRNEGKERKEGGKRVTFKGRDAEIKVCVLTSA